MNIVMKVIICNGNYNEVIWFGKVEIFGRNMEEGKEEEEGDKLKRFI